MKNVFISGVNGNMGKRYATILNDMGVNVMGADYTVPIWKQSIIAKKADGIIIATPTVNHLDHIVFFAQSQKPILCEKPITCIKNSIDLTHFQSCMDQLKHVNLRIVNQYAYLKEYSNDILDSSYNYFKSGSDGIVWDCINIIGLANRAVTLQNTSPIWKCTINGKEQNIADMDRAYILMMQDWVNNATPNHEYIMKSHLKAYEVYINHQRELKKKAENNG